MKRLLQDKFWLLNNQDQRYPDAMKLSGLAAAREIMLAHPSNLKEIAKNLSSSKSS